MFCPYYKNKQIFDGFNEMIEAFGGRPMTEEEFRNGDLRNQRSGLDYSAMEAAYITYDRNGGNFLDMTPQGKPSLLFQTLLDHFGGDRAKTIVAKSNVYSDEFFNWFGDWTSDTNNFNLDNIDYSLVDVEEYTKPWKDDPEKSNRAIRIYLKDQHEKGFFELVKDHEYGYFSVHFKTTKEGAKYNNPAAEASSKEDRKILFQQLVNAIPNGAKISTWGSLSEDGVRGLDNVGRNMHKVGERSARLKSDDSEIKIPIYQKGQDVSKVVDENGEPLVVWHSSHNKFEKFEHGHSSNREANTGGDSKAFYFGSNLVAGTYASTHNYAVYLNLKNPSIINGEHKNIRDVEIDIQPETDGQIYKDVSDWGNGILDDYEYAEEVWQRFDSGERSEVYLVVQPSQIKHVKNLGTWNPNEPNIYHLKRDIASDEDTEYFTPTNAVDAFGQELAQSLLNGDTVSSSQLMRSMLSRGIFHSIDKPLASALSAHDIPVRVGYDMRNGDLAKIVTEDKGSVIFINPNELSQISRGYAGTVLMHEIVHALTVDIINNPKTQAEKDFVELNHRTWQSLCKKFKHLDVYSRDVVDGMYALTDEKEFAACFASDPHVRQQIYELAEKFDRIYGGNKFISRLKKLVSRLVKALTGKAVFNKETLSKDIQKYEESLTNFLLNQPQIVEGNISERSVLRKVYANSNKSVLSHENFIESMKTLEKMQQLEKDYLLSGLRKKPKVNREETKVANFESVIQALQTRINALKTSTLDSITKGRLISTTDTQMQMFIVDEAGKYLAIQNLIRTSVPYIIDTVDELRAIRREGGKFSNSDYMYQMHANIGMYYNTFNTLTTIISNKPQRDRMIEEYNKRNSDKISVEDIEAIEQNLRNAVSFAEQALEVLEHLLKENVKDQLQKTAENVGSVEMDAYIEALDRDDAVIDDISAFESLGGASDASANEAVRALSHIINKALNTAQFDAQDKGEELLKLQKALKRGEKGWHLYERDEKGDFTGYLIRDLNFGKFYKDYDNKLKEINKVLIDKFGLSDLLEDSRVAPDGEDGKRIAIINGKEISAKEYFEQERNEWLNTHAERKYKSEYYEYYSKLPQRVKDNLARIRTEIQAITSNYKDLYDENGVPHYEQLSEDDWAKINILWERRRFLRKDIDEYGNRKEGDALEDAKALRKLYEEVYHIYEDPNDPRNKEKAPKKYHKAAWLRERNRIIAQYGEDSKELEQWDERNTRKSLKQNEFGEALVFLEIEKEFGEQSVSQEYGAQYQKYKEERRKILSNFRMLNGEYDHESIPQVLINALVELERKMRNEAIRQKNSNSGLGKRANSYGEIFEKYIKFVDSVQLKRAREAAHQQAVIKAADQEDTDLEALSVSEIETAILANSYGWLDLDDDLLDSGTFVPYKWLQRMETKDPQYMEFEPNDAWIDREENDLENDAFDEIYGVSIVPKRFDEHGNKLYDNSEEYDKIFGVKGSDGKRTGGSETLQALYDAVQKTIEESNAAYGREYTDNYLLPQVECTSLERFARRSTWRSASDFIRKLFGYGRVVGMEEDPNDTEIGQSELQTTPEKYTKVAGVYPDGRDFHVIPQYYTKRLKHPELISKDIVGITRDFYLMSRKYKERSLIKDDCETIIDMIRRQKFRSGKRTVGGKFGEESRTYKFAKDIAERDLYDMQRVPFGDNWFGRDISKVLGLIKRFTTARNLGMNPKVAVVGFLTTSFTHIINGLVGYKYSSGDMFKAGLITLNEFGTNLFGANFIGNRLTKNKLMLLMEMMDMSSQSDRKTEHANRNRVLQMLYKNSTFGLLSAADIMSKSTIMVATLLSYRLVNGQFMTKHMIEESRADLGEEKYKELMKEFKKSKVNAYNIFEGDSKIWKGDVNSNDTKLHVKEEYREAWEQIKHVAANKAIKNAEQADGMATRMQKAMMTRNFIGAFVLIHRQYIPLMLQQTFGRRVYDYDAQEYKGGQFRTLFNYVDQLCCSNALAAVGAGAFVGVAFGGFSTFPIVACSAATLGRSIYNRWRGRKKSFKQANEEFFGQSLYNTIRKNTRVADSSKSNSTAEHVNKVANQYQIKQTFLEVALLNCFVAPLANLICMAADNTDKDDDQYKWLLLQTLAYWARAAQFEMGTKYNFVDLMNNIKSATAATAASDTVIDGLKEFGATFGTNTAKSIFASTLGYGRNYGAETIVGSIYSSFVEEYDEDEDLIQSGPYEGETRMSKFLWKFFPAHNLKEQLLNPELKRRYQENQVMRLTKEDKESMLYDFF